MLYDRILAKTIPHGVVPWSFTYSDAHSPGEFDRAWTVHLMPEQTAPALRTSMEDGTFFGFSRYPRLEKADDFVGVGDPPKVNRITVNQNAGSIKIEATGYDSITWITNRTKELPTNGAELKIADFDAEIGTYVRAYLLGPSGILYIQPFTVLRTGEILCSEHIKDPFDFSVPLRWMVDAINFAIMPWALPLKWLCNFAIHTTGTGISDTRVTGDFPAYTALGINEKKGANFQFIQGAQLAIGINYNEKDGAFLHPEATIEDMIEMGVPHLARKIGEQAACEQLNKFLPTLARWRQ